MTYRCIYIIGIQDNPVKIGMADNPRLRLKSLQTGCPDDLQLFWHIKVLSHSVEEIEAAVGRELIEHRRRGEWFNVSVETAKATIIRVAQTIHEKNAERKGRSNDIFEQLDGRNLLPAFAQEAIHFYKVAWNDPAQRKALQEANSVILKGCGMAGLQVLRAIIIERGDLRYAFYRDPAAGRRAEAKLVEAVRWLTEYYRHGQENNLLDQILGKVA